MLLANSEHCRSGFCVKFGSRRTNHSAEKRTNQATATKLVVNASSLLLGTARARCVFVHVALSVRLPSSRALRRNDYIYRASLCDEVNRRIISLLCCRFGSEVGYWFCSLVVHLIAFVHQFFVFSIRLWLNPYPSRINEQSRLCVLGCTNTNPVLIFLLAHPLCTKPRR